MISNEQNLISNEQNQKVQINNEAYILNGEFIIERDGYLYTISRYPKTGLILVSNKDTNYTPDVLHVYDMDSIHIMAQVLRDRIGLEIDEDKFKYFLALNYSNDFDINHERPYYTKIRDAFMRSIHIHDEEGKNKFSLKISTIINKQEDIFPDTLSKGRELYKSLGIFMNQVVDSLGITYVINKSENLCDHFTDVSLYTNNNGQEIYKIEARDLNNLGNPYVKYYMKIDIINHFPEGEHMIEKYYGGYLLLKKSKIITNQSL